MLRIEAGDRPKRFDLKRVREDTGPPPEVEYKLYSRGTGVIAEENGVVKLVGCA